MAKPAPDKPALFLPRRLKLSTQQGNGFLVLDLFHRDALCHGHWISLFPREFEALWRLAETPFVALSRMDLLKSVWRLNHDPQTKRVEVAIARIRSKLAPFALDQIVETVDSGGYRLNAGVEAMGLDELALDETDLQGYLLGLLGRFGQAKIRAGEQCQIDSRTMRRAGSISVQES